MSSNECTIHTSVSTGAGELVVPQWRGRLHKRAFFATLPFGLVLLLVADRTAVLRHMPVHALVLMLAGGLAYTFGAVVLFRRRPDPSPARFGYHEVWHACTVAASACHFAMIAIIASTRA